jgi:hypothetical protein
MAMPHVVFEHSYDWPREPRAPAAAKSVREWNQAIKKHRRVMLVPRTSLSLVVYIGEAL